MTNRIWIWALARMRPLARDERGASIAEYALLVAILILGVLLAVQNYSDAFFEMMQFISGEIEKVTSTT